MTPIEAMKEAIKALISRGMSLSEDDTVAIDAITALRDAIAETESRDAEIREAIDSILRTAETVEGFRTGLQLLKLMVEERNDL